MKQMPNVILFIGTLTGYGWQILSALAGTQATILLVRSTENDDDVVLDTLATYRNVHFLFADLDKEDELDSVLETIERFGLINLILHHQVLVCQNNETGEVSSLGRQLNDKEFFALRDFCRRCLPRMNTGTVVTIVSNIAYVMGNDQAPVEDSQPKERQKAASRKYRVRNIYMRCLSPLVADPLVEWRDFGNGLQCAGVRDEGQGRKNLEDNQVLESMMTKLIEWTNNRLI